MVTKIEEELNELRRQLEAIEKKGITINLYHGEGAGSSSCEINRTSKSTNFALKVYSNDLLGAAAAVTQAVDQFSRINKTFDIKNGVDTQ